MVLLANSLKYWRNKANEHKLFSENRSNIYQLILRSTKPDKENWINTLHEHICKNYYQYTNNSSIY